MAFKDQMAADLAVFFNADEFSESVTYNGTTILAIIDRMAQPGFNGPNMANYADVMIKKSDVASVVYQDIVQFDGYTWIVESIEKTDEHIYLLKVRRKEGYAF